MRTCIYCQGIGKIANPDYPAAARALDRLFDGGYISFRAYEKRLEAIFENGQIPEDDIDCPACLGLGYVDFVIRSGEYS